MLPGAGLCAKCFSSIISFSPYNDPMNYPRFTDEKTEYVILQQFPDTNSVLTLPVVSTDPTS